MAQIIKTKNRHWSQTDSYNITKRTTRVLYTRGPLVPVCGLGVRHHWVWFFGTKPRFIFVFSSLVQSGTLQRPLPAATAPFQTSRRRPDCSRSARSLRARGARRFCSSWWLQTQSQNTEAVEQRSDISGKNGEPIGRGRGNGTPRPRAAREQRSDGLFKVGVMETWQRASLPLQQSGSPETPSVWRELYVLCLLWILCR